jgi:hypothetical protein
VGAIGDELTGLFLKATKCPEKPDLKIGCSSAKYANHERSYWYPHAQ